MLSCVSWTLAQISCSWLHGKPAAKYNRINSIVVFLLPCLGQRKVKFCLVVPAALLLHCNVICTSFGELNDWDCYFKIPNGWNTEDKHTPACPAACWLLVRSAANTIATIMLPAPDSLQLQAHPQHTTNSMHVLDNNKQIYCFAHAILAILCLLYSFCKQLQ